jgi:hypothetical protein
MFEEYTEPTFLRVRWEESSSAKLIDNSFLLIITGRSMSQISKLKLETIRFSL